MISCHRLPGASLRSQNRLSSVGHAI